MSVTVQLNSKPVINSGNRVRLWVQNCHVIATLTIQPKRKYLIDRAQTLELWQNNFTVLQKGVY